MAARPLLPMRHWIFGMLLCPAFLCLHMSAQAQGTGAWARFWAQPQALRAWALTHPFVLKRAQALAQASIHVADSVGPGLDGDFVGGWADAFRHAYWMAVTTQAIGGRRARSLGRAHERGNYQTFRRHGTEDGAVQDQAASHMDLLNNKIGIALGQRIPMADHAATRDSVLRLLHDGQLFRIKKDTNRNSLDGEGRCIPESEWLGKWENGRVVVRGKDWPLGLWPRP
jgi:hypothetical protein